MKKISIFAVAAAMTVAVTACGGDNSASQGSSVSVESVGDSSNGAEAPASGALATPVVQDGVMREGDDCVEVYFEWGAVEGADGYEVSVKSKFFSDEEFGEPEVVETTDNFYVASAQDTFDFMVEVRAFTGSGDSRVYSEWSQEAAGFSYDDSDVSWEGDYQTFTSYDDLIGAIAEGLKNGFSEDEQMSLDISTCFFMNASDYETYGYLKKDLDGDGTEELIIGSNPVDQADGGNSVIYDLYTMKDGQVVHVFDGWERNRFYLCEDGTIANEGSSGAAYSSWSYYKYSDGEIKIVESVFTDEDDNGNGHWYHSDKEAYEDESNEITEDEGMSIIEKYTYQDINYTAFN